MANMIEQSLLCKVFNLFRQVQRFSNAGGYREYRLLSI